MADKIIYLKKANDGLVGNCQCGDAFGRYLLEQLPQRGRCRRPPVLRVLLVEVMAGVGEGDWAASDPDDRAVLRPADGLRGGCAAVYTDDDVFGVSHICQR